NSTAFPDRLLDVSPRLVSLRPDGCGQILPQWQSVLDGHVRVVVKLDYVHAAVELGVADLDVGLGSRNARPPATNGKLLCHAVVGAGIVPAYDACPGCRWPPTGTGADPVVARSSLGCRGDGEGMALSMRTVAMAAAVGKDSLLRTRVRAEAPSSSSASCSPSCSGSVAPAWRAVSVSRAAMAVL